jgi:hypothetical protein
VTGAAGAAVAVGELVGVGVGVGDEPDEAGFAAEGPHDVGAGAVVVEEPKMAETSLPKILMFSSSGVPCAVF